MEEDSLLKAALRGISTVHPFSPPLIYIYFAVQQEKISPKIAFFSSFQGG